MKLEFVGQSARDAGNIAANPSRLVNCFREPVVSGGTTGFVIRSVPGVAAFADLNRIFMRALIEVGDVIYAVCGGRLFSVTDQAEVTELGTVADDPETTISSNNGLITVCAGGFYYVWDGATLTSPTIGNLDTAESVSFLGGYTVLAGANAVSDRLLQWSDLYDASGFDALNFASAETTDEPIIRAVTINEQLVVFKASGHETWRVTGLAEPALALVVGSQIEIGLKAFNLFASYPNGAAFVGSDFKVYAWNGAQLVPISTPAVEIAIELYGPDRMFFYEKRGHGFICLTFRDVPAWCYDTATGEWHERSEGVALGPWSAKAAAKVRGMWVVGYDDGRIGAFSIIPQEFGADLKRWAVSRMLWTGQRFRVQQLEFFGDYGSERYPTNDTLLSDDGSALGDAVYGYLGDSGVEQGPPRIAIRTSEDGVTFAPERVRDMGLPGRYDHRVLVKNMGQFRRMAVEVTMTAPVDAPLNAECDVVLV